MRQTGTLVRLVFNVGTKEEGPLAASARSWYKPRAAEKLGQQTRLLASPALSSTGPGSASTESGRRHTTEWEVT